MDKITKLLTDFTAFMAESNVAIPIVFGAVAAITGIIKMATGEGKTLAEIADLIDAQIKANDAAGKAEIERLRQMIGE